MDRLPTHDAYRTLSISSFSFSKRWPALFHSTVLQMLWPYVSIEYPRNCFLFSALAMSLDGLAKGRAVLCHRLDIQVNGRKEYHDICLRKRRIITSTKALPLLVSRKSLLRDTHPYIAIWLHVCEDRLQISATYVQISSVFGVFETMRSIVRRLRAGLSRAHHHVDIIRLCTKGGKSSTIYLWVLWLECSVHIALKTTFENGNGCSAALWRIACSDLLILRFRHGLHDMCLQGVELCFKGVLLHSCFGFYAFIHFWSNSDFGNRTLTHDVKLCPFGPSPSPSP